MWNDRILHWNCQHDCCVFFFFFSIIKCAPAFFSVHKTIRHRKLPTPFSKNKKATSNRMMFVCRKSRDTVTLKVQVRWCFIFCTGHGTDIYLLFNPNQPDTVCAYMIQTLVHTWRGWGCSIFIETNVKDSQTHCPSKRAAFNSAQNIFSQAQLFQNIISKSVCILAQQPG